MGNICRSPAAEGVFLHHLRKRDLVDHIGVDSAGTIDYHTGHLPDARMRDAAERRGYELNSRARQIQPDDLVTFDLVVAMDQENWDDIVRLDDAPRALLKMLSDFLPDSWPRDVPDPYYGGRQGFETVLDMLEAACPAIIDHLLDGQPTKQKP